MSKFNKGQTAFTAGEVSDKVKGRYDFEEYNQACEELQNFIVQRQGGAVKRPGMRFIQDLFDASFFEGARIVPFQAAKAENYAVIFNGDATSLDPIRVFNTDGTEATVDSTGFIRATGNVASYNPDFWKYAQSGDILALTYSDPTSEGESASNVEVTAPVVAPAMLFRTDANSFTFVTFSHPDFKDKFPDKGTVSPALHRPYTDPNVNPDIRLYVDIATVGTNRFLKAANSLNQSIPFFRYGDCFFESDAVTKKVGSYYKVQSGSTEGVAYALGWVPDSLVTSANINIGLDLVTAPGSGLVTTDIVRLNHTGAPGTTDPVIAGHPYINATEGYGEFFTRDGGASLISFHLSRADALANVNRIDFTNAGDRGIRIEPIAVANIRVTIEVAFPAITVVGDASDNWQKSAWSGEQGFPRAVVFHEQRLVFGGTRKQPDTIWMSQVGNIFNFMARRLEQDLTTQTKATFSGGPFVLFGDATATDPMGFTIASKQANIIQWLESQSVLLAGTLGAEYTISGGDSVISNESIFVKKQTDYGSNNTEAISVGDSSLFVTRDGRRVRNFRFNRDNGSYVSVNLNLLSEDIVFRGFDGAASSTLKNVEFKEMHYQPSRDTVWCLTTNDALVALTLSKEVGISAWHYHATRPGDTVKSIAVVTTPNSTYDQVWLVVERSVNSVTRRYLEKMGDDFEHTFLNNTSTDDDDTPWYTDSSIKIVQPATSTIVAGLSHLENETVDVLAGDVIEKGLTVTGGQVTMTAAVPAGTVVVVGFRYTSRLKTLDIEAGGDFGTSQGNRQRIDQLRVRLYKSQGGTYGNANQTVLFPLEYESNEVVSEIRRLDFEITPNMDNQVLFEHDDPVPFNITTIVHRGVSFD